MNDHDTGAKYLRLFGTIFFCFIGFLVALVLLFFVMRFIFGMLSYLPFLNTVYLFIMVLVPSTLFISIFVIYFKRTKYVTARLVKYISLTLFIVLIIAWLAALAVDIYTFFAKHYTDIQYYKSFNLLLIGTSVFVIFFTGILQALASPPEKDWMDRKRDTPVA